MDGRPAFDLSPLTYFVGAQTKRKRRGVRIQTRRYPKTRARKNGERPRKEFPSENSFGKASSFSSIRQAQKTGGKKNVTRRMREEREREVKKAVQA